jgi:cyclopropane-fatty-acyl-phospholipid synthase
VNPAQAATSLAIELAERGWLPDRLLRAGIRRLVRTRLAEEHARAAGDPSRREAEFAAELARGPILLHADDANQQHYEVPPAFFARVLGPRLKYSCSVFPDANASLAEAELHALEQACERAEIRDGMRLLDLGCGWGSLSLFIAERHPNARILAVSNSKAQAEHIIAECERRGLRGIEVVTANIADFEPQGRFDRIMSIEMFEHVRNWDTLLARAERWLEPAGKLFVHVFCHRELAYAYETRGSEDWMARNFFSGGIMPSAGLLRCFDRNLQVEAEWRIPGTQYARTAEAWLENLDRERDAVRRIFRSGRSDREAARAVARWRLFFLAVAELFASAAGEEWMVAQYRLVRPPAGDSR